MKGFHEVVQVSVAFKKKRGMEAILESLNIERIDAQDCIVSFKSC
jgi:hypothetical protein